MSACECIVKATGVKAERGLEQVGRTEMGNQTESEESKCVCWGGAR